MSAQATGRFFYLVAGLFLASQLFWPGSAFAEEVKGRLNVNGRMRNYLLHKPAVNPAKKAPLVIALHGDAGSGKQMRKISGLNKIADREGFYVAYPDGSGWASLKPYSWNSGNCCGYAQNAKVDDVSFIRELVKKLAAEYPINPKTVYVTGISNGGMMAHRLACEATGDIAAIAVVAGSLDAAHCNPSQPVSVLMIHGTHDRYVPYAGGRSPVKEAEGRVDLPVESALEFWARHDQCGQKPSVKEAGNIKTTAFVHCRDSTEVVLHAINGGTHAWPKGFPAGELIWLFFAGRAAIPDGETATHIP